MALRYALFLYLPHGRRTTPPEEWHAFLDDCLLTTVAVPSIVTPNIPSCNSRRSNSYDNSLRRAPVDEADVLVIDPISPTHFLVMGAPLDVLDTVIAETIPFDLDVFTVSDLSSDNDPLVVSVRPLSES